MIIKIENDNVIFDISVSKAGKVEGTNKLVPFTDGYPEEFKTNLNKYLEELYEGKTHACEDLEKRHYNLY